MSLSKSFTPYLTITSLIGKELVFHRDDAAHDEMFSFSTTLEKIGVEWDCRLKNNTRVLIISEPVEVDLPKYGTLSLTKVKANVATDYHTIIKEFWVPTIYLVEIVGEG